MVAGDSAAGINLDLSLIPVTMLLTDNVGGWNKDSCVNKFANFVSNSEIFFLKSCNAPFTCFIEITRKIDTWQQKKK